MPEPQGAVLRPGTLFKKLWCRCFPVNFAKFLRKLFLTEHPWWLLRNVHWNWILFFFLQSQRSFNFTITKKTYDFLWSMVKKCLLKLCILTTYVFKGHIKIVKIYMVKFNVSILKRLKIMSFLSIRSKYMNIMPFLIKR